MVEIIGEHMMPAFEALHIFPRNTYVGDVGGWHHLEVWELTDDEYACLSEQSDQDWEVMAPAESWWRSAEGSNMGIPIESFVINDMPIIAWRSPSRIEDLRKDWECCLDEERDEYRDFEEYCEHWLPKYYYDIMTYFSEELGASTEKNICALVTDLAKYNGLTIADIFRIYG